MIYTKYILFSLLLVYLVDASCDSLRGQYGRTDEQ